MTGRDEEVPTVSADFDLVPRPGLALRTQGADLAVSAFERALKARKIAIKIGCITPLGDRGQQTSPLVAGELGTYSIDLLKAYRHGTENLRRSSG